ncbi:MAG: hypothetical protein JWP87_5147 [Labilithrix sp.]|nr:hypothetical protein [Labilithrix sp.]
MRNVHRHTAAIAIVAVALLGCDKLGGKGDPDGGTSKENPAPAAPSTKSASAPAPVAAPVPSMAIEGVGDVPAWASDKTTKKCVANPAAKPKLDGIRKGDDAAIAGGTADISALVKELGADSCFATRKALATALNDGGFARYNAKKYDEANRYWRAALTVRPSLVIARYNLACGLALAGKAEPAAGQISEIAHAASEGDASAANFLEKAKSDKDLVSIENQPTFQAAVAVSNAGLVGPRKEPETAAAAVALLPEDFRKVKDENGITPSGGFVTYKPAVTNVWTWRPDATTELLVATIVDDPAKLGKPKPDLNLDYGAIGVFRREPSGKLTLLTVRKTGDSPPTVAAGKNGTVAYSFEQPCGALTGVLSWNGQSIDLREKNCRDL